MELKFWLRLHHCIFLESRILIGSVSRVILRELLETHMKGVAEHAQQIRERDQREQSQVIFHKNNQDDDDQIEIVRFSRNFSPFS